MRKIRRKKSQLIIGIISIIVLVLTVGYSFLSAHLMISGLAHITVYWDVHFDNIEVNSDSVSLSSEDYAPTIDSNDSLKLDYKVTLSQPGDFYEFTVDAVNDGTVDAMISEITSKINNQDISNLPTYLTYSVSYSDGVEIKENQILNAHSTETLKIRLEVNQSNSNLPESFEMSFEEEYVKANENAKRVSHPMPLYNVLENEANSGSGLALKYTGNHHDSFTEEPSKDIYHWYAENNDQGDQVLEKNNVIFANHCWQMIRTTDTGGVKMIYNGEVENNQCLNTRGTHVGYASRTSLYLPSIYWYGTEYTYDSTNKVFSVSGTTEQATWNETTGPGLIGKYTCKLEDVDGTCSTLYLIESYYTTTSAYVIPLKSNSNYSQIGSLQFNTSNKSISDAGYMYNMQSPVQQISSEYKIGGSSMSWSNSYYAASSIVYNDSSAPNKYKLINPTRLSDYNSNQQALVGKYIMNSTTGYSASYVLDVTDNMISYRNLENGDMAKSLMMSYNYRYRSGPDFTLVDPTLVKYEDWFHSGNNVLSYSGQYACDGENATCTNIKHIIGYTSTTKYNYVDSENWKFKYSSTIRYENGKYILDGDIRTIWDIVHPNEAELLNTHHYTCLNLSEECETVNYIVHWQTNYAYLTYLELKDGKNIEGLLNEMLAEQNVNTKNSIIKSGIDAWYKQSLLDYNEYIEDTVYCNNRQIQDLGFANPIDGEVDSGLLLFYGNSNNQNIYCENTLDSFSINNSNARLIYPIGMITNDELALLGKTVSRMEKDYWTITPNSFSRTTVRNQYVDSNGNRTFNAISYNHGVKPVISLKPGIKYIDGDGTMANPYIIKTD